MGANNALEGAEQRCDQQAHDAAIELGGIAGVIALAKVESQTRMRDRVTESREQFPIVGDNITIVDGDHASLFACQHVSETGPDVAAFALRARVQLCFIELSEKRLHSGAVVPEQSGPLRQPPKKSARLAPLPQVRAVDSDHDLLYISD